MSMEKTLKEILEEILDEVEQELEEATTTAGVDGYQTPFAFGSGRKKDKKKEKDVATQAGYTIAESVNEAKDMAFVDYLKVLDDKFLDGMKAVRGDNGSDAQIKPTRGDILQNFTLFRNYLSALTKKYKGDKTKLRFLTERANRLNEIIKSVNESVNEGKKRFYQQNGIGRAKYTISYHDGKSKHKDGSDFYGIQIFRNQKDLEKFRTALLKKGYREDSGYKKESVNESKSKRPVNRWLELKNDETMHPHKKMAMGLKELKYQLKEVEKFFNWYNKIKTMNELDSQNYWKRTNNHIYTIKEKLIKIAKTIQEIEK